MKRKKKENYFTVSEDWLNIKIVTTDINSITSFIQVCLVYTL